MDIITLTEQQNKQINELKNELNNLLDFKSECMNELATLNNYNTKFYHKIIANTESKINDIMSKISTLDNTYNYYKLTYLTKTIEPKQITKYFCCKTESQIYNTYNHIFNYYKPAFLEKTDKTQIPENTKIIYII